MALTANSPDFNADESIWDWIREEITANTCFGTATKMSEKIDAFFVRLANRTDEVKQRCRKVLQVLAALLVPSHQIPTDQRFVDLTLYSV